MKKRVTGIILFIMAVILTFAGTAQADFVELETGTAYQNADGTYAKGVVEIDDNLYYFDENGIMAKKGAVKLENGVEYYASKTGALLRNKWRKKKYYYNDNGQKAKGLTEIKNKLYYFTTVKGKLKKGKLKDTDGKLYITDSTGEIYRSRFFTYKSKNYYATKEGNLATGLQEIGGYYYFFKKTNGRMLVNAKKKISGEVYYFQKNGRAVSGKWVKVKGKYYYFQDDCTMARNMFIGTKWYVGEDGVRVKASKAPKAEVKKINGKIYLYSADGTRLVSQWVISGEDTYYVGADGAAFIGLQTIDGDQYYFDEDGILAKDTTVVVNNTAYSVGKKGKITGTTTALGSVLAAEGQKYVGNPYVWGGTDLVNGADCSGFCYRLHLNHGIQLMRVADDQMDGPSEAYIKLGYKKGQVIKDKDLQPGDLVFYGSASYASHVAMYIGDGKVVHAANSNLGIIVSSMDYVKNRVKNKNMRYWA